MVEIVKGDVKQNRRKVFDSFCFHFTLLFCRYFEHEIAVFT